MKILVIGGAGYIGSHVVREFLDNGYSVTVYDNLSSGSRENLFDDSPFVEGDILDYPFLLSAMKQGFGCVVHLAAFKAAGESMALPEKYSTNNITGTINILNAMCESGINKMVFSSSAAVYGEPQYLPIDEKHPVEPLNYYGFTKLEIERLLKWYDQLKGIKYAALRYFNATGYDIDGRIKGLEKNPANLLPVIMEVASGIREILEIYGDDYKTEDGTGIRDYIHVSDLAVAHVGSYEYIEKNGRSLTVNLGSETGISVKTMLKYAEKITGRRINSTVVGKRPGDSARLFASSKYAREILGWKARFSDVKTLIESTWKVYQSHFIEY